MLQRLVHLHVFQKAIQMELDRLVLELLSHGIQVQKQRGVASAQNNAKGLLHLLIPGQRCRLKADIPFSKILEEKRRYLLPYLCTDSGIVHAGSRHRNDHDQLIHSHKVLLSFMSAP